VAGLVQSLAQGETVSDSFNYTVVDQFGRPTLRPSPSRSRAPTTHRSMAMRPTMYRGTLTYSNGNVLANGVDIDHGATLDVTLISSPTGTYGSLTSFNTETGAYTYTLNAGFNLHKARRSPTVQLHGGR
jgi:hypothetical protein